MRNSFARLTGCLGHPTQALKSIEVSSKLEGYPDWNTQTADISKRQQVVE